MGKLILIAPLLLLAAAGPALSQGAQFPNAANATEPSSLNAPPLAHLPTHSRVPRASNTHRSRRRPAHRPTPAT